jgi:hypothetical protein
LAAGASSAFMASQTMETAMRDYDNSKALAAFLGKKAEIDAMLDRLQDLSDEHFNVSPDEVHWGHVGTLADYAALLKRITDSAFKEGEHVE